MLLLLLFYQYIENEMPLDRGLYGFLVTPNPVSGKILKSYDAPKSSFFSQTVFVYVLTRTHVRSTQVDALLNF